jgi:hypothetical protein
LARRYERTGPSGPYNIIKLCPLYLNTLILCFEFWAVQALVVYSTRALARTQPANRFNTELYISYVILIYNFNKTRDGLPVVSATWCTSRYAMHSYLYPMNLLSPRHETCAECNALTRHVQSVMGTECSNNKGSELCIIANRHPLTNPQGAQQHRSVIDCNTQSSGVLGLVAKRKASMYCLEGKQTLIQICTKAQASKTIFCVSGCRNNFRNTPHLHYYMIPKSHDYRATFKDILRDKTLNFESSSTRIFSADFEGGEKLSRNHLPTIFPKINETPTSESTHFPVKVQ